MQWFGWGDCCWLQKAAFHYHSLGYEIVWEVLPQIMSINDYLVSPVKLIAVGTAPPPNPEDLVLDFQRVSNNPCEMRNKYKLIDLDYKDWADYLILNRNFEKEDELFKVLGVDKDSNYNFVNRMFGTNPWVEKPEVQPRIENQLNVELRSVEGFTLFDWIGVIENASNIYTVDTSLLFLCEKLNLKAESGDMYLWARYNHFRFIDGLFSKPWIYQNAHQPY